MTDLRKAAEMALEALDEINKLSVGEKAICLPAEIDDAMEALRQALAMEKFSEVNQEIEEALKQPKREWVGLTDEEIDGIYKTHHDQYGKCQTGGFEYERTIEAKLKEKNT